MFDERSLHLLCHFISYCVLVFESVFTRVATGQAAAFVPNPRTASIIIVITAAASP
jgi:hypothetical protein